MEGKKAVEASVKSSKMDGNSMKASVKSSKVEASVKSPKINIKSAISSVKSPRTESKSAKTSMAPSKSDIKKSATAEAQSISKSSASLAAMKTLSSQRRANLFIPGKRKEPKPTVRVDRLYEFGIIGINATLFIIVVIVLAVCIPRMSERVIQLKNRILMLEEMNAGNNSGYITVSTSATSTGLVEVITAVEETTTVKETTAVKESTTVKETTSVEETTTVKETTAIKETTAVKETSAAVKETSAVKETTAITPIDVESSSEYALFNVSPDNLTLHSTVSMGPTNETG